VKALDDGTFNTVLGTLEFDEKGDVTLPGYVFYNWENGEVPADVGCNRRGRSEAIRGFGCFDLSPGASAPGFFVVCWVVRTIRGSSRAH
jgi:hypothetical protein